MDLLIKGINDHLISASKNFLKRFNRESHIQLRRQVLAPIRELSLTAPNLPHATPNTSPAMRRHASL
jgi:hypothetical protein